jgi:DNA (cytosine-5)-methyltransferase 1
VGELLRVAIEARADAFVLENVPSLLHPRNHTEFQALLDGAADAGFRVRVVRGNAAEHGVPQRRERVFVLATRGVEPVAPEPTHSLSRDPAALGLLRAVTAGEALEPFSGEEHKEDGETVQGRWAAKFREVPPGWNYKFHTAWANHPSPTFVTETRFWNFLLKLDPALPSWTLPANPGPWVGPFHWDDRRLRTVEFAALQGFPTGYVFVGNRRERIRQIGNAVPPLLAARMIGQVLATLGLDGEH